MPYDDDLMTGGAEPQASNSFANFNPDDPSLTEFQYDADFDLQNAPVEITHDTAAGDAYQPVMLPDSDLINAATSLDASAFDKVWSSLSKSLFGTDEKDAKGNRTDKGLIGEAGAWMKDNKELTQLLAAGVGGAIRSRSQERQLDEQRKWLTEQKEQDFKREQEKARYGRLGTGLLSVVQNQPKVGG